MKYLFLTFLKIGSFSFGGFMALIAVLQKQMVEEDKKLDPQILLDGVSLAAVLPGPLAVNTVGFVGYKLRGFWGGLLSMFAVTLPCFLLVLMFSVFYFQFGELEMFKTIIAWVMPAIVVIIVTVVVNMSKKHLAGVGHYLLGLTSLFLSQWVGGVMTTMGIMLAGAVIGYFFFYKQEVKTTEPTRDSPKSHLLKSLTELLALMMATLFLLFIGLGHTEWLSNMEVLLTFSSMSLTLFGGGYVIIPIIQESIVSSMQWLTFSEFNTAIAISQLTPGPILISACFIGYKVAGMTGACLATIGIFLPSGLLMITCSHWLGQFKENLALKAIFTGLRPVVIGLIMSAAVTIGSDTLREWSGIISFGILLVCSLWFKTSTPMLMLTALGIGLIGFLL